MCLQHPWGCQDGWPRRPAWGPVCKDRAYPEGMRGEPQPTSCWRPCHLRREAQVQAERGGTCPSAFPAVPSPDRDPALLQPLGLSLPPVCIALFKLPEIPAPGRDGSSSWLPPYPALLLTLPQHHEPALPLPLLPSLWQGVSWKPQKAVEVLQPAPYPTIPQPCQPRIGMGPWAPAAEQRGGGRQTGARSSGEEGWGLLLTPPPPLPPPRYLPTKSSLRPSTAHVPGGVPGTAKGQDLGLINLPDGKRPCASWAHCRPATQLPAPWPWPTRPPQPAVSSSLLCRPMGKAHPPRPGPPVSTEGAEPMGPQVPAELRCSAPPGPLWEAPVPRPPCPPLSPGRCPGLGPARMGPL